jgi:hypothetical protein
MEGKLNNNKYEQPFWKIFIRKELRSFVNPASLFMLLFMGGLIGLFFVPLTVFLYWFDAVTSEHGWYLQAIICGSTAYVSFVIGEAKKNHYVTRELFRLLDAGKIDDEVFSRINSAEG